MLMSLTSWILTTFLILDPMYFRSKWCPGSQLPKITLSFFHTWTFSGTLGYQKKYKWRKNPKISGIIQNLFQVISSILFFFPYRSQTFSTRELFHIRGYSKMMSSLKGEGGSLPNDDIWWRGGGGGYRQKYYSCLESILDHLELF